MEISKCAGDNCSIKTKCFRYRSIPDLVYQSYTAFEFDHEAQECDGYILYIEPKRQVKKNDEKV